MVPTKKRTSLLLQNWGDQLEHYWPLGRTTLYWVRLFCMFQGIYASRPQMPPKCQRHSPSHCFNPMLPHSKSSPYRTALFLFIFFSFIFISWRLITLQYCSGFCHTLTWISHGFTCVPHPDCPSHLPLHPIPLGLPSAPGPSTCLMHPTWAGDLFHPR